MDAATALAVIDATLAVARNHGIAVADAEAALAVLRTELHLRDVVVGEHERLSEAD